MRPPADDGRNSRFFRDSGSPLRRAYSCVTVHATDLDRPVVRASPDGYTLLYVAIANAINAALYDKLNFNFIRDIAPIAGIIRVPNVMAVHPSVPAKTVPEFVAHARANPHSINMVSGGNGTSTHVVGDLFMMMTGIDMVHVAYRGGGRRRRLRGGAECREPLTSRLSVARRLGKMYL